MQYQSHHGKHSSNTDTVAKTKWKVHIRAWAVDDNCLQYMWSWEYLSIMHTVFVQGQIDQDQIFQGHHNSGADDESRMWVSE